MKTKSVLSTAIAIAVGFIVLSGYFLNLVVLTTVRAVFLNWAVVLAGLAVFLGVANLAAAHAGKVKTREKGWPYSLLLVGAMLVTLLAGLVLGPQHPTMRAIFNSVQLPVEASLMALLAITLTSASIRLLQRRPNAFSITFLATALLILLGTAAVPWIGYIPILSDVLRPEIAQVFAAGGARGILIGVALGTLTTGLRVLFGVDRPYGEK